MTSVKFTASRFGWSMDPNGMKLTISTPQARYIADGLDRDKEYVITVKERGKGRSLSANAYLWALLSKCADVLGTTKEELYISYVRKCGPYKDFTLTESEARTFRVAWSRLGTGWPTEQVDFDGGGVLIRAYYGSSTYSSKQMARLIDMVVADAKEAGIDVMSESERALLIGKWRPETV